jgi:hypothetical protein
MLIGSDSRDSTGRIEPLITPKTIAAISAVGKLLIETLENSVSTINKLSAVTNVVNKNPVMIFSVKLIEN